MLPEPLEIAITQYLDGSLPPEERAALEAVLAVDPVAQATLAEHEKLTALLRSSPLPELDWAELSRDLATAVTGTVDEAARAGDLRLNELLKAVEPAPQVRWEALGASISARIDAELASADAEDARLDELLHAAPMPAVDFESLAASVSAAVARADEAAQAQDAERSRRMSISWVRRASQLAVAACVVVGSVIGLNALMNRPGTPGDPGSNAVAVVNVQVGPQTPAGASAVILVEAPRSEKPAGEATIAISVGPSEEYVANSAEESLIRGGVARGGSHRSPIMIAMPVGRIEEAPASMWE